MLRGICNGDLGGTYEDNTGGRNKCSDIIPGLRGVTVGW
jgi:hypothetical protein